MPTPWPCCGTEPASRFQLPASSYQLPATSFQLPASSFQLPAPASSPSYQLPASSYQLPASRFPRVSASRTQRVSARPAIACRSRRSSDKRRRALPGSSFQLPASSFPLPAARCPLRAPSSQLPDTVKRQCVALLSALDPPPHGISSIAFAVARFSHRGRAPLAARDHPLLPSSVMTTDSVSPAGQVTVPASDLENGGATVTALTTRTSAHIRQRYLPVSALSRVDRRKPANVDLSLNGDDPAAGARHRLHLSACRSHPGECGDGD